MRNRALNTARFIIAGVLTGAVMLSCLMHLTSSAPTGEPAWPALMFGVIVMFISMFVTREDHPTQARRFSYLGGLFLASMVMTAMASGSMDGGRRDGTTYLWFMLAVVTALCLAGVVIGFILPSTENKENS